MLQRRIGSTRFRSDGCPRALVQVQTRLPCVGIERVDGVWAEYSLEEAIGKVEAQAQAQAQRERFIPRPIAPKSELSASRRHCKRLRPGQQREQQAPAVNSCDF